MHVASLEMIQPHFEPASIDYQQQQTHHQQQQQQKQQEQQHQHTAQQQHQQQQQQQQQRQQQQQQQISKIISNPPPAIVSAPNGTTMCVAKLMIGLDHAPPAFNVRSRVLGDGGTNLNYIRTETGAIVTLRGRGSMNLEPQTMQEAPEPLHLFIEHPSLEGLQSAKQLAKNLIETLQEELSFFQENNIPKANFQLIPQSNIVQTTQVTQMPPIIRTQHVTQPNGIIHQPPPTVLGPPPPNFVQHPPALPQSQPPPPQIIQQAPTIIQSHVPVQIHQQPNNVVISQIQTTAPPAQIANVSNPPPGTQIRPPIVQIKNTPGGTHLSQPPPSIQIQQAPAEAAQQIIVNPAPPYQVQYIQQNPSIQTSSGAHPSGQVTIQHLIQPQPQPVQGIVQTTIPPPQFDHFQRPPQTQQIITVQGSTAFMVPPPNIIHQTAPQPQNQIIFQTQQPILTHHPPPELTPMGPQAPLTQPTGMLINGADGKKVGGPTDLQIKQESLKLDEGPPPGTTILQQIPTSGQLAKTTVIPVSSIPGIPISQPPPPIMSVPPPTVQHIVGNTIITSQPNAPISHGGIPQQIFSQIPVSIQSFAPPPQQMQVSGSHFVVSAPQPWPVVTASAAGQQIQQVPVSTVPSIQITTQPMRNPNEIHIISQPTIISAAEYRPPASQQQQIIATSAFNPQIQPPQGVQVQFHTVPPPPQQIITSLANAQTQPPPQAPQSQLMESQQGPQHQIIINAPIPPQPPPPPPSFTAVQYSTQEAPKPNVEQLQQRPPPQPQPPQQQTSLSLTTQSQSHAMMLRPGQKRKISDEDVNKTMPPKIGMGMSDAGRNLQVGTNGGILTAAQAKCIMSSVSTGTATTTSTTGVGLISSQISADHLVADHRLQTTEINVGSLGIPVVPIQDGNQTTSTVLVK